MSKLFNYFRSFHGIYFLCFSLTAALLVTEYKLQLALGFIPCVMSYISRCLFLLLAFLFLLISVVSNSRSFQRWSSLICLAVALVGVYIAGKHVWLQITGNTTGLVQMMPTQLDQLSLHDLFKLSLSGTADCAVPVWSALRFTLAEWALGFFILFSIISLTQSMRKFEKKK